MLTIEELLPTDASEASLVGRIYDPAVSGPSVVVVVGDRVVDATDIEPTVSTLLARPDLLDVISQVKETAANRASWPLELLIDAISAPDDMSRPRLLTPIDLQVIKAAGVTFVESMLERVIEERAKGDPDQAAAIRDQLVDVIGGAISTVRPGSPQAAEVKKLLQQEGLWSQYLEVGIGPDPEIFSKAPVLSAVGSGQQIGVLARSVWNNPEPEIVLAVRADGTPVAATLGNDVNLRDFEGRSALLLTEAKDNNGSCAIGPFLRLFDGQFGLDDVRGLELNLRVDGTDGFTMNGFSSMRNISRDPLELVGHAYGDHHQYPDGFVLFTGTLFSPTQDRRSPGAGFTHDEGDLVRIATPQLGTLINAVTHSEKAQRWEFGIWSLISNLRSRNLI